jgi:hypothetical protein
LRRERCSEHDEPMRGRTQDDGSTPRDARHDYWGVVLDSPDAPALAHFYAGLLGWKITPEGTAIIPPDGVDRRAPPCRLSSGRNQGVRWHAPRSTPNSSGGTPSTLCRRRIVRSIR